MSGALAKLAIPDGADLTEHQINAAALAGTMVKYHDIARCAKILGMDYSTAWSLYNSPEYAHAHVRLIANADPKDLFTKTEAVETLIEEARNQFDGTPATRIAAISKLSTILGYDAPTEHKLTGDVAPVISLTLQPPSDAKKVDELPVVELVDPEDEDIL